MRRPLLLTLTALGSLVCLIGSTGLFAALTDTALTGTNSATSAGLAPSADIQLATATPYGYPVPCGTFSDNLASGLVTATGLEPGESSSSAILFCIRNTGSQPVSISAMAVEVSDTELACTGDEIDFDSTSCGSGDGELSTVLQVPIVNLDCETGAQSAGTAMWLDGLAVAIGPDIAAGATACYHTYIVYSSTASASAVQAAQSDSATWRYQFTGDAS